jgi:calcium-dependent protein kinase
MRQIFSAIAYCHANNIVHRDIKPENVLLEGQGQKALVKIIDFGTSVKFAPGKKIKGTFGTPYYIAPEVIRGIYNEKCDLWSCGVILFILLTGKPPFDGKNEEEITQNVRKL